MFLLDRIGFLALAGLLAQTGMSWLFAGLLAVLLKDHDRPRHLRAWCWAFVALATGLSVMCFRFFRAHDDFGVYDRELWRDGGPLVCAIYSGYLVAKVLFAQLLIRGVAGLAERQRPVPLRRLEPIVIGCHGALPWLVGDVNELLALQVPMMVGYCLVARSLLPEPARPGLVGRRLVRIALLATAVVWLAHGTAAIGCQVSGHPAWSLWLALNSYVDSGVELLLGAGLIVTLLQDVHERLHTAEQEQSRLRSEAERDEKLRALGVLVSGVAHELNNPLTAILGFAEELGDPEQGAYAGQIVREQAERCRGIVRSLSSLAGECVHPREVVDCRAVVERVARGFAPQLQDSGVALQLVLSEVPAIIADPTAIEQVIANLITNALQVSPLDGTVRIAVSADAATVVIDVDDQGPGVPHELRTRLFEPFFTTKAPGRGTGLGLAVAFAIMRAHAGQIVVDEKPSGRGARFRLRLPIANREQIERATIHTQPAPRVTRRRLLVIDDEAAIRAVLRRRGQQLGWDVDAVDCAEEALQRLADRRYDVVLCDVRMPGIGGQGFHQQLRKRAPNMLDRCLFFSGEVASPDVTAFAASLSAPMITKPFDFAELFRRAAQVAGNIA